VSVSSLNSENKLFCLLVLFPDTDEIKLGWLCDFFTVISQESGSTKDMNFIIFFEVLHIFSLVTFLCH